MADRPVVATASHATTQAANWSGSLPVLLSLAPASISSPTPPRAVHKMVARASYLHLALREEVVALAAYAPSVGLARGLGGKTVEEPPDDEEGDGKAEGGDVQAGKDGEKGESSDAAPVGSDADDAKKESSMDAESRSNPSDHNNSGAFPECWFEDEASGTPLRWHLFAGVLFDLMRGKATMKQSSALGSVLHNFLPWRIRVHFTSYPADLLPLDDGLEVSNDKDDEAGECRITNLVKRMFRNSLKQALFLQYASSKVAMAITKHNHERIWEAVLQSDHAAYHDVNAGLQAGIGESPLGTQSTIPAAHTEEGGGDPPQLTPVRILLDGLPAMQRPLRHRRERAAPPRPALEALEDPGTYRAPPHATLGDVLAECLPDHFEMDPTTGDVRTASGRTAEFWIQGIRPSGRCAAVDLWRALSHPDHFLYVVVITE